LPSGSGPATFWTCRQRWMLYRDMVADVRSGKATVTSALTRLLRLQQIASGFLPAENDEDGTTNLQQINTGKQELLADLLEDLPACDRCPDPGRRHWVRPSALGQAGGTRIVVMSERPWEVKAHDPLFDQLEGA
jgi:hypothetical protein